MNTNHNSLLQQLRALTALDAPSGYEEPVLRHCRDALAKHCAEVAVDVRGNVRGRQPGSDNAAPLVLIMSHADEIGLQVTRIDAAGYVGFTKIGGVTDSVLPGTRVRMLTAKGTIPGFVGVRPGHVLTDSEARAVPLIRDMYLDVGAGSADEAANWGIEPGTPAVFDSPLVATQNPARVVGKAIDNRAGIVAQLAVAGHFAAAAHGCQIDYLVTVEEEIGLRGAEVAARDLKPDVLIALDTVPAGGPPDVAPADLPWEIGKGPLIKVRETKGLITHRPLREHFRRVAAELGIPVQLVVDTAGITDATSGQQSWGGVAALTLGLPRRYSHSANEMLDLADLEYLIRLVIEGVSRLSGRGMLQRLS